MWALQCDKRGVKWNSRFKTKKKSERIGFGGKHGPLGQRAKERHRDAGRERESERERMQAARKRLSKSDEKIVDKRDNKEDAGWEESGD